MGLIQCRAGGGSLNGVCRVTVEAIFWNKEKSMDSRVSSMVQDYIAIVTARSLSSVHRSRRPSCAGPEWTDRYGIYYLTGRVVASLCLVRIRDPSFILDSTEIRLGLKVDEMVAVGVGDLASRGLPWRSPKDRVAEIWPDWEGSEN